MKYEGDDQNCEFFVYVSPDYTFVIIHNSTIYAFEDDLYKYRDHSESLGRERVIWICEELEEIDIDEIDCWVD